MREGGRARFPSVKGIIIVAIAKSMKFGPKFRCLVDIKREGWNAKFEKFFK